MPVTAGFYDDCRDANRLATDWLQTTPARWTSVYEAPYAAYKFTTGGAVNRCTLMNYPMMSAAEVDILLKPTDLDAMMGVLMRNDRITTFATGMFYIWFTGGFFMLAFVTDSGATPVLSNVAYALDLTKWYRLKVRVTGRHVQAKTWIDGTQEPDWIIDYWIRYGYMRPIGTIGLMGSVRNVYYSQIRLLPMVRSGGP
jgi:hypothetical protein